MEIPQIGNAAHTERASIGPQAPHEVPTAHHLVAHPMPALLIETDLDNVYIISPLFGELHALIVTDTTLREIRGWFAQTNAMTSVSARLKVLLRTSQAGAQLPLEAVDQLVETAHVILRHWNATCKDKLSNVR